VYSIYVGRGQAISAIAGQSVLSAVQHCHRNSTSALAGARLRLPLTIGFSRTEIPAGRLSPFRSSASFGRLCQSRPPATFAPLAELLFAVFLGASLAAVAAKFLDGHIHAGYYNMLASTGSVRLGIWEGSVMKCIIAAIMLLATAEVAIADDCDAPQSGFATFKD
jgi:hypothetical protein